MLTPNRLRQLLAEKLQATYAYVEDESHRHAGHRGRQQGSGGHYRVQVVSPLFAGKTSLQRHRLVYAALAEEMGQSIHALALQTYSPEEVAAAGIPHDWIA
ncbi:BolA family transcriptional regulator [Synechococcus sp. B60.1]|uniref:BolA family protein n=1 Tax=Synechococcus sp. B60.1 TaxID=2964522 RepID=UPI0039C4483F